MVERNIITLKTKSKLHKVELAIDALIESILVFYFNTFYDAVSLTYLPTNN